MSILCGVAPIALLLSANSAAAVTALAPPPTLKTGSSTGWFGQIGLTTTIQAQAYDGKGITIGFIDTGVIAARPEVTGRVSTSSACAAITFKCSNGYYDDNDHGTSVASIASSENNSLGTSMLGVAPLATILAEKVLNSSGSGTDLDVAMGVSKAVTAGANVINLSLTYTPTAPVMNALNQAAAAGAVVVYAGGNNGTALRGGANTTGATDALLSHLIFVGSVNSLNQKSSFSATPGTGSVVGKTRTVSYASLWLMAPGEGIATPYGPTSMARWTGTSMAAPMVSGAVALLESTWSILKTNGTAAAVLFATATDLGAPGVDAVYGHGLMNVTKAFQPVGSLQVKEANGSWIRASQLTGTQVKGGALGTLSTVSALLSHYTAFDAFSRNFYVNLSGLLSTSGTVAPSTVQVFGPTVTGGSVALPNGTGVTFARTDGDHVPGASFGSVIGGSFVPGMPQAELGAWMVSLNSQDGMSLTTGRGFSLSPVYSNSLWGEDSAVARLQQANVNNTDLLNLASGGQLGAFAERIGEHTRIAFAWSETASAPAFNGAATLTPHAMAESIGLQTRLGDGWTGSVTVTALREGSGLLGSQYSNGGLDFGPSHHTVSMTLTTSYDVGKDTTVVADATLARTNGFASASGLMTGMSALLSRGYELGIVERNVFGKGDALTVAVAKPLRVIDGSVGIATTGVDEAGLPVSQITRVGLAPSTSETDLSIGYSRRFYDGVDLNVGVGAQFNAGNVAGANGGTARLRLNIPL
jgi:hypothetical protein